MRLLNSQKNELYDIIESEGLSPAQFEFEEGKSAINEYGNSIRLTFKNSEYYFAFESLEVSGQSMHYAIYCPGDTTFSSREMSGNWQNQLNKFCDWLTFLNREITVPDKWKRLQLEANSIIINFENEENKFSVHEFNNLSDSIETLKSGVLSLPLPIDQAQIINAKLDHLVNLAENMNKFDWKGLFIGTIISVVIQLGVTPDNAKSLWELIKQTFGRLLPA